MADITYSDKDKNSTVEARRKWRDTDANEVKRAVNSKEDKFLAITENEAGVVHPAFPTDREAILYLLARQSGVNVLNFTTTQTNVTTIGGNNGSITVSATGGTTPYTYSLNSGAYVSSGTFPNLPAGSYVVRVKDAANATVTKTVTITQPVQQVPTLSLAVSKTDVTVKGGNDGAITATGQGGTTPYQYNLNGGNYLASGAFTGLTAGTYTIGVKDASNDIATSTVTISQPAEPQPTVNAYYGWKTDNSTLTPAQIQSAFPIPFTSGQDFAADYRGNTAPRYLWMAEPIGEPAKTKWFGSDFNKGSIGGEEDLFGAPVVSGGYRFYITAFQTQNTDTTIQFRKA